MKEVLKLRNDMAELDKLHRFIEKLGRKLRLSKKYIVETNLVLEEVVSNIIAYAYRDYQDHFIKISAIPQVNGALVLRVEDSGRPFNPLNVAEPELTYDDLENCNIGGLGIHLVRKLMDDVSYDYRECKNVLEMKKSI
jgi:serine/threonine-protein kinase RsbW